MAHNAKPSGSFEGRIHFLSGTFCVLFLLIIGRLVQLQIIDHGTYAVLASDQHDLETKLLPTRGQILVRDPADRALHPFATNRDVWMIYAIPRAMKDRPATAHELASLLNLPEEELLQRFNKDPDDPYEPLLKEASTDLVKTLQEKKIEGVGFVKTSARLYPERGVSGQLIGFVSFDEQKGMSGKYGIEGAFQDVLAGKTGSLVAEKDAGGRRLPIADATIQQAVNGSDVVLTIDRAIQYEACALVKAARERHDADSASMVIMDPETGAIMAMCSYPDFDPAEFGNIKDVGVLNNPIVFSAYEPGSIFKPITMAAGVHSDKVSPKTTYVDTGEVHVDDRTIRNSDLKAHGLQTMTQALDESLNTGMVFVQRQVGKDLFRSYVESFGFGKKTGMELTPEGKGTVASLSKKGSIFAATASFGQGITVTPIQMISAYGALANGGRLMRPYIVSEIIHPDGSIERTKPQEISRPIDARTSRLISGMLVSVVENGHGKRAGVPGYWVAGKTGTAQVARSDGLGYEKDITIGSFAGYAPASDPRFVMLVKIDHPRDVQWAESSAAPLFGQMSRFLLNYLHVPTERPVVERPAPAPAPVATSSTTQ